MVREWIVLHPIKPPKESDHHIPDVYDISDSANWANKAVNTLSVFRRADSDIVEIHVRKIRFKECGYVGSTELIYNSLSGRYTDGRKKK